MDDKKFFIFTGIIVVAAVVVGVFAMLPSKSDEGQSDDSKKTASLSVSLTPNDKADIEKSVNGFLDTSLKFGYDFPSETWESLREHVGRDKDIITYTEARNDMNAYLAFGSPLYSTDDLSRYDTVLMERGIQQAVDGKNVNVPDEGTKKSGSDTVSVTVTGDVSVSRRAFVWLGTGEGQPEEFEKTTSNISGSKFEIEVRRVDGKWGVYDAEVQDIDAYAFNDFKSPSKGTWSVSDPVRIAKSSS